MRIYEHFLIFVFTIVLTYTGKWVEGVEQYSIPDHLLSCYKNRPPVLPQTMDVLLEIIRKMEMSPNFNMDMKMFTNALLHKFRVDGIEKDPDAIQNYAGVIPYKTSGFQTYRMQVLLQYLIPDNNIYFPLSTLSETEKCNLHWMLSSTVDRWERGDEKTSCPQSITGFMPGPSQTYGAKSSSCPQEWGVVYQDHGTLNPGAVIAAIAAGLAPLQVQQSLLLSTEQKPVGWTLPSLSDNTINNTYVATLAGDLAEVIEFQAAEARDIYIGGYGAWNDSYIPTAYYFMDLDYNRIEKKIWQITDAEIIGDVDGLILSYQVPSRVAQLKNLRLSQVLEMYYSDKGLLPDNDIRACNREMNMEAIIRNENQTLLAQVENFAKILSSKVPKYPTDDKFINPATRQALDKFISYMRNLLRKNKCVSRIPHSEKINLNIIVDETFSSYKTLQLIMFLSRAIDVGYYSSSMTIINGYSGSLIVNETHNTSDIFLSWRHSQTNPQELILTNSLLSLKKTVENSIERNKSLRRYKSQSHIALILGYSNTISDADFDRANSVLSSIKALNPDMKFVFVTSRINSHRFVKFTALHGSQNDRIVSVDNANNIHAFTSQLQEPLSLVPRSLIAPFCSSVKDNSEESEYEEYITPGQPHKYRIHPDYLCGSSVLQIKLLNSDYGDIQVCMSRDEFAMSSAQCRTIRTNEFYTFTLTQPCTQLPEKLKNEANSKQQWLETCKPVFLDVSTLTSLNRCSENECRFPDQVKFNILLQGLKCVEPYKSICSSSYSTIKSSSLIYVLINALFISVLNNFIS